ncbi:MAG: PilZ domain-containing protein [Acidobacteria bacterium]|nr:PilZ domain-containing protein [Acidobacteriota bacterium]
MSATVLIASPEHLPALKERDDLGETIAFADTDALRALDVITRQRPNVVALERVFAATSRGAALINRIRADPALTACEIRIVAHDSSYARLSPRRAGEAGPSAGAAAPALAVADAPSPAVAPLDQRGTRRAPRVDIVDGVQVQIDGNPASLVNLSIVGAQVISPTILKPNQRVRVTLADSTRPMRIRAAVAWASFEIPKGAPRYRAGIEFFDADPAAVMRFIEANKR